MKTKIKQIMKTIKTPFIIAIIITLILSLCSCGKKDCENVIEDLIILKENKEYAINSLEQTIEDYEKAIEQSRTSYYETNQKVGELIHSTTDSFDPIYIQEVNYLQDLRNFYGQQIIDLGNAKNDVKKSITKVNTDYERLYNNKCNDCPNNPVTRKQRNEISKLK